MAIPSHLHNKGNFLAIRPDFGATDVANLLGDDYNSFFFKDLNHQKDRKQWHCICKARTSSAVLTGGLCKANS